MERVLSLPFFAERMHDGGLTEDMSEVLWDQHAGYDDDGAAPTCDEAGFRSLWGAVYELDCHADWRRLVSANKETGHMNTTVSQSQVLSMAFVSELVEDGCKRRTRSKSCGPRPPATASMPWRATSPASGAR